MRRLVALLILLSLVTLLFSCGGEADFSHAEFNIPLPDSFERVERENYDAAFTDGRIVITVTRLSFDMCYQDGIPDTMNSKEFASFWINRSAIDAEIIKHGGVDYAEYTANAGEDEYYYVSAFYRTQYAYFIVAFVCPLYNKDIARADILEYMSSVYFEYD